MFSYFSFGVDCKFLRDNQECNYAIVLHINKHPSQNRFNMLDLKCNVWADINVRINL